MSFATSNRTCVTNTLFPHKHIYQTTCYLPNPKAELSLKYVFGMMHIATISPGQTCAEEQTLTVDRRLVSLSIGLNSGGRQKKDHGSPLMHSYARRKTAGENTLRASE